MKLIFKVTFLIIVYYLICGSSVMGQPNNSTDSTSDTTANKEPSRPIIAIHGGFVASDYDLIANFDLQYNPPSNLVANVNWIGGGNLSIRSSGEGVSMYNFLVGRKDDREEPKVIGYIGPGRIKFTEFTSTSSTSPKTFKRWGLTVKGQFYLLKGTGFGLTLTPFANLNTHKFFGGVGINLSLLFRKNIGKQNEDN